METTSSEVIIIGTGFGGMGAAIRLRERGITDFVMLERARSVGGTWRDNTYPGAACDVPARLYSFSFEQKADWSRTYPTQPELRSYLEGVAEKYDLLPHCRFERNVEQMRWCDEALEWTVTTSDGVFKAPAVISASGGLAEPKFPDIPGVQSFQGHSFHSARWDHDCDLTGKRVAVIGAAASAIQLVPEIAKQVEQLTIYQRTPNWIIPRKDRTITALEKWLLANVAAYRETMRSLVYWSHEARVMGLVLHPMLMEWLSAIARRHLVKQVADPVLREQVTPDYVMGCKRILISNDWYPTLARDNVELVTEGIREIRNDRIVERDGREREVDAIIFATGFHATENPIVSKIHGRGGRCLADDWREGEYAYRGVSVHGYPNLYLLAGPNTGIGHTSMLVMIEAQIGYVMEALESQRARRRSSAALEVREEVERHYNEDLQRGLAGSTWATGCNSWYRHRSGKITTLWPGFTFTYRRELAHFDIADYLAVEPALKAA